MNIDSQTGNTLILFSSLFETGGIQRYNKQLCDAFLSEFPNHSFTAVLLDPVGVENGDIDMWENIRIKFIRGIRSHFLRKFLYVVYVAFLTIKESPTFLICAHPGLSFIGFFAKKIFGLKYAVVTYGKDVWDVERGIKYIGLKEAEIIVTISKHTKDRMILNGIGEEKIKIVPCATDHSLFCPKPINEKMAEQFHPDKKTILFTSGRISSLERYKGA